MTCPFSLCDGTGWIFIDDLNDRPCRCTKVRTMRAHLGPEIASAPALQKSPLYRVDADGTIHDSTGLNLLIRSEWPDLLPHLKWVLIYKGLGFRCRIVTDERLKTVYVGAESYAARAKSKRDDVQTFNSLADVVGPDIHLVIIRLGFLGHKNVAMPGILKETLMLREAGGKPTWLVEEPSYPFGEGHLSYNLDVGSYIERHFDIISLEGGAKPQKDPTPAPESMIAVEDVSMDDSTPIVRPPSKAQYVARPVGDDDDLSSMFTSKKKGKFGKKKGWGQ